MTRTEILGRQTIHLVLRQGQRDGLNACCPGDNNVGFVWFIQRMPPPVLTIGCETIQGT